LCSLYYVYPKFQHGSFNKIATEHIKELKQYVKVQEIDESTLDNCMWLRQRNIVLHPILYVTIGDKEDIFNKRQRRLKNVIKVKNVLGGFETSDTDQISSVAVNVLNNFDFICLPSTFALEVFRKSGVSAPLYLVPHGISEEFCVEDKNIMNEQIKKIYDIKNKNKAIMILYFLQHSEYRKGADIAYDTLSFIQMMHRNVFLILKSSGGKNGILNKFRSLKTIEIPTWLKEDELRQLYDVADILIVPSRGGGFELNAIEGLARGLPTIVPNAGCFKDYIEYCIPVDVDSYPQIFRDNPIHVGRGWEIIADSLSNTLNHVILNIEDYKENAEKRAKEIREKYLWKTIVKNIFDILKKHGVD